MLVDSRWWIGAGLLLLSIGGVWAIFIGPTLTQIPENFTYTANLYSLDNFYDENINDFVGAYVSNSSFTYEAIRREGNTLRILNHFHVQSLTGNTFFEVNRLYRIDPITQTHVTLAGDRPRSGYLFGKPGYSKQEYTYWHANYDNPIQLTFVGEEKIGELVTYRFHSDFVADQTADLKNLPGVPTQRGVNVDVSLDVWIEPATGYLINYNDEATAYYYDIHTGERLHPWNHFSNTLTEESITLNAAKVRVMQRNYFILNQLIPILFALFGIALVMKGMNVFSDKKTRAQLEHAYQFSIKRGFQLLIVITIVLAFMSLNSLNNPSPAEMMKIGIIHPEVGDASDNLRGFKDGLAEHGYIEGKNVEFIIHAPNSSDIQKQVEITKSLIDQKVNLFYTIGTRITIAVKGVQQRIPIVFGLVTYPVQNGLVKTLQNSGNNLVGTRGHISAFRQFLAIEELVPSIKTVAFIHLKGDPNSEIQFKEFDEFLKKKGITMIEMPALKAEDIPNMLNEYDGTIDAIYGACDVLIVSRGGDDAIIEYSLEKKIPTYSCSPGLVEKGFLISASANFYDVGKLAGEKAGAILSGIAPTNLETEGPETPFITINTKTANTIGLTIPPHVLANADEVVE